MKQMNYLISDASKLVEVESHVLRYWEEELSIPIKRNELGHRYYTQEDIDRFREIKNLKEQGLQLKAIRMILKNGKLENVTGTGEEKTIHMIEIIGERDLEETKPAARTETGAGSGTAVARTDTGAEAGMEMKPDWADSREEKSRRLQLLLQHMISEAVRENNRELYEELRDCILKEMDYQFRQQEEREEQRENGRKQREEDHYLRIDELLRDHSRKGRKKEKNGAFWSRKKPSAV